MSRVAFLLIGLLALSLTSVVALELQGVEASDSADIVPIPRPPVPTQATVSPNAAAPATERYVEFALARPLFSRDRRPTPAVAVAGENGGMALPRLAGILVGPFGRTALFAGGDGRKSLAVAEGGTVGPYTIKSIEPYAITVDGPDGEHEVRPSFDAAARVASIVVTQQQVQQSGVGGPVAPIAGQLTQPNLPPGLPGQPAQFPRALLPQPRLPLAPPLPVPAAQIPQQPDN